MELTNRLDPVLAIARETAHDVDRQGRFPTETLDALRASGLLGLTLPTEAGGLGAGPHEFARTIGQLASACGSSSMIYLMHVSAAMTVASYPPTGQPDLLSRLASGAALGSLAFSETGSRSHFWAPVSKSSRNGADVRLDAPKSWVTSAGRADVYVVSTLNAEADTIDLFATPRTRRGSR